LSEGIDDCVQLYASSHFTPGEEANGIQFKGGCVGTRDSLDILEKRNSAAPSGNQSMIPFSSKPYLSQYND